MLMFFNSNSSLAIWLSNCLNDDRSLSFEIKIGGGLASLTDSVLLFVSSGTSLSLSKVFCVVDVQRDFVWIVQSIPCIGECNWLFSLHGLYLSRIP